MATEDRFLTFQVVAAMLGSAERPFTRQLLNKLIRAGELKDNGLAHKARRISRKSVLALMERMEAGTFTNRVPENKTRPRAKAPPKTRSTAKSRRAAVARSLDVDLDRLLQLPTGKPR